MTIGRQAFITGATGMIGAHLTRRLCGLNWGVHVLSRHDGELLRLVDVRSNINVHVGDMTQPNELARAVAVAAPDVVFHLAGTPFNPPPSLEEHYDVNVGGMFNLIKATQDQAVRFVYTSTAAVYGSGAGFREVDALQPATDLGGTKAAAGEILGAHCRLTGKTGVELRLFTPYGPWERPGRLIPHIIRSVMDGRTVELTGGEQRRDYVYIDDVVEALILSATVDVEGYRPLNICSGKSIAVKDLAGMILDLMESDVPLHLGAQQTRRDEIMDLSGDISAAGSVLGWAPKMAMETGLRDTISWYREHADVAAQLT